MKSYLLTLYDSIIRYQGRKRLQMEDREQRNSFNAFHHLSTLMGYKDIKTLYKMVNQSTSRVKIGLDDIEFVCVETMDASAIEDFLAEVKEKIEQRRLKIKNKYHEQLELLG